MTDHLTEDMLIKYQFDLAGVNELSRITDHLAKCEKCRAKLEDIKQKFSALDLLAGQPDITESLIEKTVSKAKAQASTTGYIFRKPLWLAAAAVLMVAAIAVMISKPPQLEKRSSLVSKDALLEIEEDTYLTKKLTETEAPQVALIDTADIPDTPPFAPASAIELNVLPKRESTQLTIYNSADLTLVREKRKLTLKPGFNWLQFMWSNTLIDPTSLTLEPMAYKGKIDIQLLSYPARLKDVGRWLIRSEVEGQVEFEITYLTSGINWRAFYMGTLSEDATKIKLEGYVRVANNSGEDYENAQTRLIVGKVNLIDRIAQLAKRQYPYNSPLPISDEDLDSKIPILSDISNLDALFGGRKPGIDISGGGLIPMVRKQIKKEGLSEYFLYTIEGTETIRNKWSKRLPSLDIEDIPVESLYKYNEEMYGQSTVRFISFTNDKEHQLGETPIPNGNVKVYRTLADSHLSYEGATNIKYIPVNEKIELDLGAASKVKVHPKLMDFKTDNYRYGKNEIIAGWDQLQTWQIELNNTTDIDAKIEITRGFETSAWEMDFNAKGIDYEHHDATHARFTTIINPQTKRTFEYTVKTYHGTRTDEFINRTER